MFSSAKNKSRYKHGCSVLHLQTRLLTHVAFIIDKSYTRFHLTANQMTYILLQSYFQPISKQLNYHSRVLFDQFAPPTQPEKKKKKPAESPPPLHRQNFLKIPTTKTASKKIAKEQRNQVTKETSQHGPSIQAPRAQAPPQGRLQHLYVSPSFLFPYSQRKRKEKKSINPKNYPKKLTKKKTNPTAPTANTPSANATTSKNTTTKSTTPSADPSGNSRTAYRSSTPRQTPRGGRSRPTCWTSCGTWGS